MEGSCVFMPRYLCKSHLKLPKVVQKLLFQIDVALHSLRRTDLHMTTANSRL